MLSVKSRKLSTGKRSNWKMPKRNMRGLSRKKKRKRKKRDKSKKRIRKKERRKLKKPLRPRSKRRFFSSLHLTSMVPGFYRSAMMSILTEKETIRHQMLQ